MLRLLLARHGESEWQVRGADAGSDSALTDLGWLQADRLGRWLAEHIVVDHVYASPLQRARATAKVAASHLDLPVDVHDGLKESWFLVQSNLPAFATPAQALHGDGTTPEDEDYQLFRTQVGQVLEDILSRHADGTVLIVAHAGTIGTIVRLLLGSDTFTVNVGNTTVHSFTWNGGQWHIEYIDRWEHLRDL